MSKSCIFISAFYYKFFVTKQDNIENRQYFEIGFHKHDNFDYIKS